ncbi:MAG: hypothetical protein WAN50_03400 [Minisyncoccia bacterium]
MSSGKAPSRVIDGPYANWGTDDEIGQFALANNGTLKIGQPVAIDVTQLGPDNNIPNNGAALPLCERLVATTSANAGPLFGVVTGVTQLPSSGVKLTNVNGVPTYTNTTGSTVILPITVRQTGWAYVYAGAVSIASSGSSITVGSKLVSSTTQPFAVNGTAAIGSTIGFALASAINANQQNILAGVFTGPGSAAGPGVVSVVPNAIVGITPNTIVLIDSLASGVQEAVSVGSISYPTFSVALANAHPAGFRITGPATNPAVGSVLISTPGTGVTISGLVATWVNIGA